ncbi:Uncharacterised protein [Escherichia coli]|uniref:Uncharacterized protein n=1 Tax=Escherichia coli TaxID=562 RepID=A0A376MT68_ECOLX|nr:Uncharacterised protein [Escherichia coli]
MHYPPLWQVIRIGIVLGYAVIPNRNIICCQRQRT